MMDQEQAESDVQQNRFKIKEFLPNALRPQDRSVSSNRISFHSARAERRSSTRKKLFSTFCRKHHGFYWILDFIQ